jgi:hypothetical protein
METEERAERGRTGSEEVGNGNPPRSLVFVHLSDLHFRAGLEPLAGREAALRDQLLKDIPSVVRSVDGRLEAILLTGDLARSGQRDEYSAARDWLDDLCGLLGLDETRTLMCPGNHDVDWSRLDPARRILNHSLRECPPHLIDGRIDEALEDPEFVLDSIGPYQDFASRCACDVEGCLAWELEEPLAFGPGYGLVIRGASTILNSDGRDGIGTMAVQTNQLLTTERPGIVRMLLMHHSPYFWRRPEPRPGNMGHNIVLYGHTHTPEHNLPLPSCLELTAGAVHPEEHEFVVPTYNVIEISIDESSQPDDPAKAYALVRVFRREFNRATNLFEDARVDPSIEELIEIPRAANTILRERPTRDQNEPEVGKDAEVSDDGNAELQPPLETAGGQPTPSRRIRVEFERLGSGDRIRVLNRLGIPTPEITSLAPHRQVREVARRIVHDGKVEQFLEAVQEIDRQP